MKPVGPMSLVAPVVGLMLTRSYVDWVVVKSCDPSGLTAMRPPLLIPIGPTTVGVADGGFIV